MPLPKNVDSETAFNTKLNEAISESPIPLEESFSKGEEDSSESSTPQQIEEDGGEDDSLSSIPQPSVDNIPVTSQLQIPEESSSERSHHGYYNVTDKKDYYNELAAKGMPLEPPQDPIKLDPNDYESMYSIRRELDLLKVSSNEVANKIDSLGSRETKHGERRWKCRSLLPGQRKL